MQRYELRGKHILIGFMVVMIGLAVMQASPSLSCTRTLNETRGSRFHGVPCHEWPTAKEARRIMEERSDIVRRIENIRTVHMHLETGRCEGKAELIIYFGGLSNIESRDEAWELIGDDEWFFGIPYSLVNS